jgi:poly[(R)-3-hydroxyalkanoate] polymerase subunit PhaC
VTIGPNALIRAQFDMSDVIRRAQGDLVGAFGFDPSECPYRTTTSHSYWCLRDYGGENQSPSLLIIAAPIKKPYIWDLTPSTSSVRFCLRQGLHVHLLEWVSASSHTGNYGIDEYILAISEAVTTITTIAKGAKPYMIGHSLGGTLAALYGAFQPETIKGLVLLGAPLCFEPSKNQFRDALISLVPRDISEDEPFSGSLLSHASALASPQTFIFSRLMDAALSVGDPLAMELHARVERWALDEIPLPGKLVHEIINWLYRENRFCRGHLKIHERFVGPHGLSAPTLMVINTADQIASVASVIPFTEKMTTKTQIIQYPGEVGVCLQHLGILVGRQAQATVWPDILSWIKRQNG